MVASKTKHARIPNKRPKANTANLPDKGPRIKNEPENHRTKKPSWNIGLLDFECPWSFGSLERDKIYEILDKLKHFETMTWQEVLDASGGKRRGNNSHEVPICDLIAAARIRLKQLKLDDAGHLFSLRLSGVERIWGILDGSVLKILWYDENHEICPTCH